MSIMRAMKHINHLGSAALLAATVLLTVILLLPIVGILFDFDFFV